MEAVAYLVILKPLDPSAMWHQMLFRNLGIAREKWHAYHEYVSKPEYEYIGVNIVRVDFDPDTGVGTTTLMDSFMPVRKTVKEYHKTPPTKVDTTEYNYYIMDGVQS